MLDHHFLGQPSWVYHDVCHGIISNTHESHLRQSRARQAAVKVCHVDDAQHSGLAVLLQRDFAPDLLGKVKGGKDALGSLGLDLAAGPESSSNSSSGGGSGSSGSSRCSARNRVRFRLATRCLLHYTCVGAGRPIIA
jgi:hypothetical protein